MKNSITCKLKSYSAMATAVVACSTPVDAGVVYTDIADLQLGGFQNTTYDLDLDGDGQKDFELKAVFTADSGPYAVIFGNIEFTPFGNNQLQIDSQGVAMRNSYNDIIGSSNQFSGNAQKVAYYNNWNSQSPLSTHPWPTSSIDVSLGLKIEIPPAPFALSAISRCTEDRC